MRRRDILLQAAVLPIVAALGGTRARRGIDAVRRRDRAQPGARPGAEGVPGARCHAARHAEEPGVSGLPLDPIRSWPRAVARPGAALHRRVLPSRLPLQGGGQDLRGRQRPRRADPLQPGPVHLRQGEAARPRTSASPASACTTRSTAPTISTRSAPFSAPAISARWRRTRATGCRRGAWRSRPRIPPARSSRCSARSGWSGRARAATRSWFMRCSTARVRRRRSASPSVPASRPCSTPRWCCIRAPTLPLWVSRRSPRCSCSTPTTARASMTIAMRCTIRTDCCCGPARASRSGVRSPIRASCRSASSPTAARAASG